MTRRLTAVLAIIASGICCVFLGEHRIAAATVAAPPGSTAVCHAEAPSSGGGWAAFDCTVVARRGPPVSLVRGGGGRGMSAMSDDTFSEIAYTLSGEDSPPAGPPLRVIVGAQPPTAIRIPSPRKRHNASVVPQPRKPAPEPACTGQPTMILVDGLDRAAYDTHRGIFMLPAEASEEDRVAMMLVLMRERR